MTVGETLKLEPTFHGAGGAQVPAEEQGVTWTSSDPDVVMVDVNGNIKALKEGTATITVHDRRGAENRGMQCDKWGIHPSRQRAKQPPVPKREAGSITAAAAAAGSSRMRRAQRRSQISTPGGSSRRWITASQTMYITMTLPVRLTERKTAKCDRCDETGHPCKSGHGSWTQYGEDRGPGPRHVRKTEISNTGLARPAENISAMQRETQKSPLPSTVISAVGHKPARTEAKAATCTEDGNIEYWTCETCGKYFSDEALTQEIEKKDTVIEAAGHGKTELKNEKEATCTAKGYTGDKVCTVCGEVLEKGQAIPMLAHSYKDGKCTACGTSDPDYKPAIPADPAAPDKDQGGGNKDTAAPGTNDPSSLTQWLLLLAASGCTLTGVLAYSRRRKH